MRNLLAVLCLLAVPAVSQGVGGAPPIALELSWWSYTSEGPILVVAQGDSLEALLAESREFAGIAPPIPGTVEVRKGGLDDGTMGKGLGSLKYRPGGGSMRQRQRTGDSGGAPSLECAGPSRRCGDSAGAPSAWQVPLAPVVWGNDDDAATLPLEVSGAGHQEFLADPWTCVAEEVCVLKLIMPDTGKAVALLARPGDTFKFNAFTAAGGLLVGHNPDDWTCPTDPLVSSGQPGLAWGPAMGEEERSDVLMPPLEGDGESNRSTDQLMKKSLPVLPGKGDPWAKPEPRHGHVSADDWQPNRTWWSL